MSSYKELTAVDDVTEKFACFFSVLLGIPSMKFPELPFIKDVHEVTLRTKHSFYRHKMPVTLRRDLWKHSVQKSS